MDQQWCYFLARQYTGFFPPLIGNGFGVGSATPPLGRKTAEWFILLLKINATYEGSARVTKIFSSSSSIAHTGSPRSNCRALRSAKSQ